MTLDDFMRAATKREHHEVARVCNDSVNYLYQLAGGHGRASPQKATLLEAATRRVAEGTGGRLEAVPRETLVRHPEIFDPEASLKVELPY